MNELKYVNENVRKTNVELMGSIAEITSIKNIREVPTGDDGRKKRQLQQERS